MNLAETQSKILNDLTWDEASKPIHGEISAWGQIKNNAKSKSLELKNSTFRPKLMLPRPMRIKQTYRNTQVSPQPSRQALGSEKVEKIIFKLIEKSKKTAEKLKKIGQKYYGDKVLTKIPFLNYKLNLPRSLNSLKTPDLKKRIKCKAVGKIEGKSFDYHLNGISYTMKGPSNPPMNYLSRL